MHSLQLQEWQTVIRWCEIPGDGVPLVCLPGLSFAAAANFMSLVTQPEFRGRRILMIDYIGSGYSGHSKSFGFTLREHSQSIAAVLNVACSEPAQFLGYSMGGAVAISLALSRPELVAKLVVCEGNLKPGGGDASKRIAAANQDDFVNTKHPERMETLAKAAVEGDAFSGFLWAARSGADPRGIHGNAKALVEIEDDFEDQFLALPMERHFVYGEQTLIDNDGAVRPDVPDQNTLREHGIGTHIIPGVGHGMMIDDPIATSQILGRLF